MEPNPPPQWTVAPIEDVMSVVRANHFSDSVVAELDSALGTWATDPTRFAEHIGLLADIHLTAHWAGRDPVELNEAVAVWSRLPLDTVAVSGLVVARLKLLGDQLHFASARQNGGDDALAAAVSERCTAIREQLAQLRSETLMRDIAQNASKWTQLVADAGQWQAAAIASDLAARAYDQLVLSVEVSDRLSAVGRYRALSLDSASALVRANRVWEAVRTVENSRQRLLRSLETAVDFELLAERDPVRYERYTALFAQWEEARTARFRVAGAGPIAAWTDAHKQAEARLIDLLNEIRTIPGLARFQRKLGSLDIVAAAADGPLLYIWSGKFATCLVLILPDGSIKQVAFEPGSEVIDKIVGGWVDTLEPEARTDSLTRIRVCATASHFIERLVAPAMLELLTAQLRLPEEYTGWRWGLATLVVSGSLSHIACHGWRPYTYDDDPAQIRSWMPLKYAPSARQLLAARERSPTPPPTMRLLSLADPQTPAKLPALPCSLLEQELVGEMSDDRRLLRGSEATRAALLGNLAYADVVHLACHGRVAHGLEGSRLELADGPMGFKELWGSGSLTHLSLAVLSACSSGRQDRRLPEETMDVGSLLLALGAPAVVATLWPVDDLAAALFISQMFRFWRQDQLPVAAAVCASGQWLKNLTNRDLLTLAEADPRWMPHIRRYVRGLSPEMKRFAEPYYWAAFAYFGA